MSIISDREICSGKPVVQGTRLWVGLIVANAREMGIEEFAKDFDIAPESVREAIEYCAFEQCVSNSLAYCQDCRKRTPRGGETWKLAQELKRKYFINS